MGPDEKFASLARAAFELWNEFDLDHDSLLWRTDGEYAPLHMSAACNDLFAWGGSDAEDLSVEGIKALRATILECKSLGVDEDEALLLWCARSRGRRPQVRYYENIDQRLHVLFDACAPESTQYGRPGR